MLRALSYVLRKFFLILAVTVITLAVLVQIGRSFSYLLSDYRPQLERLLSQQSGVEVRLKQISADWSGLQPVLDVQGIEVDALTGERLLAMDSARLRLDIIDSVLAWRPVWGNVELSGGVMSLRQDQQGRWKLQGVSNDGSPTNGNLHDTILDVLLASRRIAFNKAHLDFHFYNGEQLRLNSPSLLLENSGNFHRLVLRLDVAEHNNTLYFLLEGRGDPRDKRFTADAYLQLKNVPANKLIDGLLQHAGITRQTETQPQPQEATPAQAVQLTADAETKTIKSSGEVSANLWFGRKADNPSVSVVGDISVTDVSIPLAETDLSFEGLTADVSGQLAGLDRWHLALQQSHWVSDKDTQLALDIVASRARADAPLSVLVSRLDLAELTDFLQNNELLATHPALRKLVDSLDAKGEVQSLELSAAPSDWSAWRLATNVDNVSVGSWNGVPAFTHVSAYVEANAQGGSVQLDSRNEFSMAFPGVYRQPLHFDQARGQVAWHLRPDAHRIYVNSGPLVVSDGDERAEGYFHLEIPWQSDAGLIDLTVYTSAENMSANQYRKYLPTIVPDELRRYLAHGIGEDNPGEATRAAFIYRGAINSSELADHSVALALDVTDGYFNYHPEWPAVRNLEGHLLLDDTDLYTRFTRGQIYNSDVINASVTLKDNPVDEGKVLAVTGQLDGIASDGLRILRQSVLRHYVGDSMDSWYLHGDLDAVVDLTIPLTSGAAGSYHNLNIDVDASMFALDNYDLELADFSGKIFYNSDTGLRSEQLQGQLFGHNAAINLTTQFTEQRQSGTLIDVDTRASVKQLARWSNQPGLLFAEGEVALNVHVELDHGEDSNALSSQPDEFLIDDKSLHEPQDDLIAAVAITADLENVKVNLPAPLGKKSSVPGQLVMNYILGKQTALADVHYLDQLRAMVYLEPESQRLLGGAIALGEEPTLLTSPALHFTGKLDTIDVASWQQVWQRYADYSSQSQNESVAPSDVGALASLAVPLSADLQIAEQSLGGMNIQDLRLQLRQLPDAWDFIVTSDTLTGELNWPLNKNTPARLNLSHLRLPKPPAEDAGTINNAELSVALKPRLTSELLDQLRPVQVTIEQFKWGDESYGRWQFNLQPAPDALLLTDVQGEVRGLTITGRDTDGAILDWQLAPERTQLIARVSATDMAEVMQQWNAPQSIESESADYKLNLNWPGGPAAFELVAIEGDVEVNIGSGRFIRDSAIEGEGLLRLMGLFNFDSLARRLRLDFSDLYKSGLTFDEITGAVHFSRGQMAVAEPVLLRSPSSRMQLTGAVNLVDQTLDTRLVATLPMGGNLTVIAALAAGLPAAAGVFVISKLFEEQMNKMTSISYSITGDWDDPVTAFDRAAEVE
ncbi:YhdP family protein [Gilvimarinus polysaccharolyticus]|uniref:YhdP family protein n=1 Tax=Gilvimarinus polysaccharolyticus TaxID=863921 RepID=UPI000673A638|nr:YhdP family protein [Gilvimarinus polysaccharolyticus]